MNNLFPIVIVGILWAFILNLCKKSTKNNFNVKNLVIIKVISIGLIGIIFLIIDLLKNKETVKNFLEIDNKTILVLLLASFLEIIASYYYFFSLKNNDVSWCVSLSEALVIILSTILSFLIFKDKITKLRAFGIIIILFGMCLVNSS
tara:strand:+ start:1104 stop:1544 length:441 start_codon:yes stop_codon:yes gene_type:complete